MKRLKRLFCIFYNPFYGDFTSSINKCTININKYDYLSIFEDTSLYTSYYESYGSHLDDTIYYNIARNIGVDILTLVTGTDTEL